MKKYKHILIIILAIVFISGCIQEKSLTRQTIENPDVIKGCPYSDGSICNQSCCMTEYYCGNQYYSYKKCDILTGSWGTTKYKNPDCTGSCVFKQPEELENKKEIEKTEEISKEKKEQQEMRTLIVCDPVDCNMKDKYKCISTTKWIYDYYCYSDTLCTCDLNFEYNSIDCGYVKPKVCTPNTFKCDGKLLRKCNEDGSYWSYYEFCSYGCENGNCKRIQNYSYDLSLCKGYADCFVGTVTRIIDGDTIDVNGITIRLALTDTPESYESEYTEATLFTKELCPVGSEVLVDEDDGQTSGSYGRVIAVVYCSEKNNLNKELLIAGMGIIDTRFCSASEFNTEDWAKTYGCEIETITSDLANCFLITNFHYDAEGNDNYNLNDEYVTLKNICSETIDLTDWTIKDEATHIYTFPDFNLVSEANFTLYTGSGQDTTTELYWGNSGAVWNNEGDSLFLRDKGGKLVLSYSYT